MLLHELSLQPDAWQTSTLWTIAILDGDRLVVNYHAVEDNSLVVRSFPLGGTCGFLFQKVPICEDKKQVGFMFLNIGTQQKLESALVVNFDMFVGLHSEEVERAGYQDVSEKVFGPVAGKIKAIFHPDTNCSPQMKLSRFWMFPDRSIEVPPFYPIKFDFVSPLH